jgi:hypothetical protein
MFVLGMEKQVKETAHLVRIDLPENLSAMPLLRTNHYLACGVLLDGELLVSMIENTGEVAAMRKVMRGRVAWYELDATALTEDLDKAPPKYRLALLRQWVCPGAVVEIVADHPDRVIIITGPDKEGIYGNGKRMVLVFTSEERASDYMFKSGMLNGYTMPMPWDDLVVKFGNYFKYAMIDPDLSSDKFSAVRLK